MTYRRLPRDNTKTKKITMSNIDKVISAIKKAEGGWSNNPNDKGGCTMSGITIATYREFFGNKTCADLKKLTDREWEYIFRKRYWNPWKADEILNTSIALLCVDMGFNSGTVNAIKRVQACLGLTADGIVGPKTLAALNAPGALNVFQKIWNMRAKYYLSLSEPKSQRGFFRGWLKRLLDITFE